ncbi:unnamed protein product, partial [Amoebophrya sp. A120]|eukprot:GSA120T00024729001.1
MRRVFSCLPPSSVKSRTPSVASRSCSCVSTSFNIRTTDHFRRMTSSSTTSKGASLRPRSLAPLWLVADMDDTLVAKRSRDLKQSPCYEWLLYWMRDLNHPLLIVTSDDGYRPFRLCWDQFPEDVRKNLFLSTAEGASLWTHRTNADLIFSQLHGKNITSSDRQEQLRDPTYTFQPWWLRDQSENSSTRRTSSDHRPAEDLPVRVPFYPEQCLPKEKAFALAKKIWKRFAATVDVESAEHLPDSETDTQKLKHCFRRYQADQATSAAAAQDSSNSSAPTTAVADDAFFLESGKFLPRGPLLWINQAGPIEYWEADPVSEKARWSNMFLMGCPRPWNQTVVNEICEVDQDRQVETEKEVEGKVGTDLLCSNKDTTSIRVSGAPRSVCFSSKKTEKSCPLEWLMGPRAGSCTISAGSGLEVSDGGRSGGHFSNLIRSAVIFGDQPYGNDASLRKFAIENETVASFHSVKDEYETAAILEQLVRRVSGSGERVVMNDSTTPERDFSMTKDNYVEAADSPVEIKIEKKHSHTFDHSAWRSAIARHLEQKSGGNKQAKIFCC